MAKITRHGGTSYTEAESKEPIRIRRAELGRVDKSPETGMDSSVRSKSELKSSDSVTAPRLKPAPTTENPSKVQEQAPDSSVDLTGGVGLKMVQTQSVKPKPQAPPKKVNPKATRVRSMDEFDEFD